MINYSINQLAGIKISDKTWKDWLSSIQKQLKLKKDLEISVALVGDSAIKKLNNAYRGKNQVTDVLSFNEMDSPIQKYFQDKGFLGEIIICYSQAERQAKKAKHSTKKEIQLLLTHGFLHLSGYDHEIAKDAKLMRKMEEKILGKSMIS